jgi:hypothetical protein
MGKDKKKKDKSGNKDKAMYQCENCQGVSKNKKDVCKPGKVSESDLSGKDLKKKPCKD